MTHDLAKLLFILVPSKGRDRSEPTPRVLVTVKRYGTGRTLGIVCGV